MFDQEPLLGRPRLQALDERRGQGMFLRETRALQEQQQRRKLEVYGSHTKTRKGGKELSGTYFEPDVLSVIITII